MKIFLPWLLTSAKLIMLNANSVKAEFAPRGITMAPTIRSFLASVGVSGAEVGSLTEAYEKKTSPSIFLACQVAKFVLGRDKIDTAPLNETVVDENWYENQKMHL
jgi:hypothetical protein